MFRQNAALFKDDFIRLPQIQLVFSVFFRVKYLFPCLFREIFTELIDDILADLVTVLTDGRSHRRQDIPGVTAVLLLHFFHCVLSNLPHSPSPAGMGKSDDSFHRVHKIQRHAIRVKSHKADSRHIRHQTVHVRIVPLSCDALASVLLCHHPHIYRVSLMGEHHILAVYTNRPANPAKILPHCIFFISPRKA